MIRQIRKIGQTKAIDYKSNYLINGASTIIYSQDQNLYRLEMYEFNAALDTRSYDEDNNMLERTKSITKQIITRNITWGVCAPYTAVLIIRGIGYRAILLENSQNGAPEFPYQSYLSVRVGHSFNVYKPIPNLIGIKVLKKDRKLVIYGSNKQQVSDYADLICNLKPPSVYTGRGIRIKKMIHRRKLGKKDIRKGRFF
jgi:ribosomal protein L6P/L9E